MVRAYPLHRPFSVISEIGATTGGLPLQENETALGQGGFPYFDCAQHKLPITRSPHLTEKGYMTFNSKPNAPESELQNP